MTIYVGNIPYAIRENEIAEVFQKFGKIVSIKIITDKFTGRSKGFGFVEMETEEQEDLAVKECNRCVVAGRSIVVSKAHSRKGYDPKT